MFSPKMFLKVTFAVLSLLVGLSCATCAGSAGRDPHEYLSIDRSIDEKELRFVVKRIESGDWGRDLEVLTKNLKTVRNVTLRAREYGTDLEEFKTLKLESYGTKGLYFLSSVVEDLLDLYSDDSGHVRCHNLQGRTFARVVELKFGSLQKYLKSLDKPPKGTLAEYLRTYGHLHLKQCLSIIAEDFEKYAKGMEETEAKLDALVAMGRKYPFGGEDANLLAAAEELDLAKGKFDAKHMLEAVRSIIDSEVRSAWNKKPTEPGELLEDYIDSTCRLFRFSFPQVDTYNLARVILPETANCQKMPLKFRKLNEYSRICFPFTNNDTGRSARANVLKNMKRQKA